MAKEHDWDDPHIATPPFREYMKMEEADPHLWWKIGSGHHQNLFSDAVDEIDRLEGLLAEFVGGENKGEKWPPKPSG